MPSYDANVLPSTTGFDLGSPTQRWDAYLQNLDISGDVTGWDTSDSDGEINVGSTGGTATAPTTAPVLLQHSTTGGSIADGTYYCVWTGVNLNGETTASPETSITISAGTGTARISANAAGRSWWTGYFAFNVYCGTTSGGPYYRVTPYSRTFTVDNNTVSRDANGFVTLTLTGTASMGVADRDTVVVSGATGCTDNPNGTFTIYSHVASTTNSSITFKHAGATESGCGGSAITVAFPTAIGLSTQPDAHYLLAKLIFNSIPGSGTQPPSTNTAAIDDIQVALNSACDFTNQRCLKSVRLGPGNDGTGGTINQYFLSTPLIVPNGATIRGRATPVTSNTQESGARIFCGDTSGFSLSPGSNGGNPLWRTDGEKVGCVMTLTDDDAVYWDSIHIASEAHAMFRMHGVGGAASSSASTFRNSVWATSHTGCVAALRIRGKFYYDKYERVELAPGSTTDCFSSAGKPRGAAVMMSNMAGGNVHFTGPIRWTVPAKHDAIQNLGGVTDPDVGSNEVGFTGHADVWLQDIQLQHTAGGGTGVACRCQNTILHMTNVSQADLNVSAGTDAMWQFGHDGDGETANITAINTNLSGVSNNASVVKFVGLGGERLVMFGSSIGVHATASVDFNNLNVQILAYGSGITGNALCDPRSSTAFINRLTAPGSGSNHVMCFGGFASNDANAREGPHLYVQGGLVLQGFRATASQARIWGAWTENGTAFNWYRIDPDTASQKFMAWDTNDVSFLGVNGTTVIGKFDHANDSVDLIHADLTATLFANLGTPSNGRVLYCSDCTITNPCAGGGTGAIAKRLNGVWVCN